MTANDIEMACVAMIGSRANFILPNAYWGLGFRHELDLLVISRNYVGREIEIKVSAADLKKDKDKNHLHSDSRLQYLYFAVPEKLLELAKQEIPARAGIIVVRERESGWGEKKTKYLKAEYARKAKKEGSCFAWDASQIAKMSHLAMMRYWKLKREQYNSNRKEVAQ